jgi:transcriptional regulator with XRE-family HTH domain
MPCFAPNRFDIICPFEPYKSTSKLECSGITFTTSQPARRCPICKLVPLTEEGPARGMLLVGLALADLGRPSPEAVRLLRLALDLTAAGLAQLLGVTPETISHWENGRTNLPRAAWVTLACLAAETLARPPSPAAWLRAASDPPRAPKQVAIDVTPPAPRHLAWIVDPEDERRETLRYALVLRGVASKSFRSPALALEELQTAARHPDVAIVVPGTEGAAPYLDLVDKLAAEPAPCRVLAFGRESAIVGPFADHPARWAGKVRPTDEAARRVLDELETSAPASVGN